MGVRSLTFQPKDDRPISFMGANPQTPTATGAPSEQNLETIYRFPLNIFRAERAKGVWGFAPKEEEKPCLKRVISARNTKSCHFSR